jgi:uncharacterized protein (TIGR02271 family)
MLTQDQARTLIGATAVDSSGDKIGKIGQVYLDDQTGQPQWISVNTGFFGTSESLVPLESATMEGDGVRVGYAKALVKDAPKVDADQHLDPAEEQRLYQHYGLEYGSYDTTAGTGTDTYAGTETYAGTTGHDTTRTHDTDDAMTLSAEELHVGTERQEVGRARLRKYVVTDTETVTVPVTREEVRLEREPITEANRGEALSGPDLTEAEHEVVLTEERPVVQKETVPVERVRLETETVTENRTVTEDVRHEEIEAEGTGITDRDTRL